MATIIVRYGADMELGARQFDDLDVDATNAAFANLVAMQVHEAFPDADVDVSYDRHNAISDEQRLFVDGADQDDVTTTLHIIEDRVLSGECGDYTVEVAE